MADSSTIHRKNIQIVEEEEEEDDQNDEDYMGDLSKFIPTKPSEPPKNPKKTLINPPNNEPSKKKSKFNNWQEQYKLKKERKQQKEDEQTLKNTQSAIPESNIGFKMLAKMGYVPGKGIGKEEAGREEPIGIEIRRGRAGVGREDAVKVRDREDKERARREAEKVERRKREEVDMMEGFEARRKLMWRWKKVRGNYEKAKAVVDQLENREVVEVEKDEEGGEDEEEEEEVITEEDLLELLVKLREEHRYCLFCGCQYESMEALLSNCPGLSEDDH